MASKETKNSSKNVRSTNVRNTVRRFSDSSLLTPFPQLVTYTYKEYPNLEFNKDMQDVGIVYKNIDNSKNNNLFCIFDGHGSDKCAKLCSAHFGNLFEKFHKDNPINPEYCFNTAYKKMDDKALHENCVKYGCTATTVFIEKNNLTCANIGDSSCMLVTQNEAIKISYDHTCDDPEEVKRVKEAGGTIMDDRLEGVLVLTRSFGDFEFKNKGLIAVPYIKRVTLNVNYRYCVIASDGIWDVIDEKDLFELSKKSKDDYDFCGKIVLEAIAKESQDNISCIVIGFH